MNDGYKPLTEARVVREMQRLDAVNRFPATDKGTAALFSTIFKGEARHNTDSRTYYVYDGRRWQRDSGDMNTRQKVKMFAGALQRYAASVKASDEERAKYLRFALKYSQKRPRGELLEDSRDEAFFRYGDFDKNQFLLNCRNGVLNLLKKPEFLPHSPEMLLSSLANVSYVPDADCPVWKKFVDDVMQGDTEKIRYIQKIFGLSLTGVTQEETAFIFYGATTRNGKSTMVETIGYMLGDYFKTMRPESLATRKFNDSRQASGDIARLDGCRLCNASEPPKGMLFDVALFKLLTGRDKVTARRLHESEFEFYPRFKLIINTNFLPRVADDSVFSSDRLNVISFDRHFKPAEQDKRLKGKLRKPEELSGILNWCIEGLRLYRQEGLTPPKSVRDATAEYREQSDKIGGFIAECMEPSSKNIAGSAAYIAYERWCTQNGYGCENKGNFFADLRTKGMLKASGTVGGKSVRNVICGYALSPADDDEGEKWVKIDDTNDDEIPFD